MNFIRVLLPWATAFLSSPPHMDNGQCCYKAGPLTDAQKQQIDTFLLGFVTPWMLWWCGRPMLQLLWILLQFFYLLLKMFVYMFLLIWDDIWIQAPGVR